MMMTRARIIFCADAGADNIEEPTAAPACGYDSGVGVEESTDARSADRSARGGVEDDDDDAGADNNLRGRGHGR
jgi:hypothetical protein